MQVGGEDTRSRKCYKKDGRKGGYRKEERK